MRFYVETSDEYGPIEYASFDDVNDAKRLARELLEVGFRYAIVADRDELIAIEKLGDIPSDWK